jgi:hypothetical protein
MPPVQYPGLCGCTLNLGIACNQCGVRACDDSCQPARECDPTSSQLCGPVGNWEGSIRDLCSGDLTNLCNASGHCDCTF